MRERKPLSHVRPSATPWTAAYQAPLSMGFSRQEYWRGGAIAFSNISSRMTKFAKTSITRCWWGCGASKDLTHCWQECKWYSNFRRQYGSFGKVMIQHNNSTLSYLPQRKTNIHMFTHKDPQLLAVLKRSPQQRSACYVFTGYFQPSQRRHIRC